MNMSAKLNVDVNVNGGMDLEAFGGKVVLSDDDIHERIIDAVIDQRLLPGTKLVEDKLGHAFGVSHTRIRQVLIRLAHEQVVTLEPNKGATVAQPSVDDAREVFEARALIEGVLVQRFIERATPEDFDELVECIEAEEEARREGDQAAALRLSGRFHLLIAEVAAHETYARMLKKLISRTSLILMSYAPTERARPVMGNAPVRWVDACMCDAHRGVLTALRSARGMSTGWGQPVDERPVAQRIEDAAARMREHLNDIESGLCFNLPSPVEQDMHELFPGALDTTRRVMRGALRAAQA
jgi:DNA-binding GntR family transcriptional regulator